MKWNRVAKSLVLALAVVTATSAFAGGSKGTLHLSEAAQINGQTVPAGTYQLRWEGTGSNVELSVLQGKQVVTKAQARVVESKQAYAYDSTLVDRTGSAAQVKEVRFGGKKFALVLGSDRAEMGEGSSK